MTSISNQAFRSALVRSIVVALGAVVTACGDDAGTGGEQGEGGAGASAQGGSAQGGAAQGGGASQGGSGHGGAAQGGAAQGGAAQGGAGGAGGQSDVERCFGVGLLECPAPSDAAIQFGSCTTTFELVTAWLDGPTLTDGQCCYQVDVSAPNDPSCAGLGRPFVIEGVARVATVRPAQGWSLPVGAAVSELDPALRARLAQMWARDAAYEHASVASFGKLALELLSFAAPAELVEAAHVAALDEVRHARASFALASQYAGAVLGVDALPMGELALAPSLAALAAAAVREGCCGETEAAVVAAMCAEAAQDPAVREALRAIAEEEARHAALAYAVVRWAIEAGGDVVRAAALSAAHDALRALAERSVAPEADEAALVPHGRLGPQAELALRREAARDVVVPAMRALFGDAFGGLPSAHVDGGARAELS